MSPRIFVRDKQGSHIQLKNVPGAWVVVHTYNPRSPEAEMREFYQVRGQHRLQRGTLSQKGERYSLVVDICLEYFREKLGHGSVVDNQPRIPL